MTSEQTQNKCPKCGYLMSLLVQTCERCKHTFACSTAASPAPATLPSYEEMSLRAMRLLRKRVSPRSGDPRQHLHTRAMYDVCDAHLRQGGKA